MKYIVVLVLLLAIVQAANVRHKKNKNHANSFKSGAFEVVPQSESQTLPDVQDLSGQVGIIAASSTEVMPPLSNQAKKVVKATHKEANAVKNAIRHSSQGIAKEAQQKESKAIEKLLGNKAMIQIKQDDMQMDDGSINNLDNVESNDVFPEEQPTDINVEPETTTPQMGQAPIYEDANAAPMIEVIAETDGDAMRAIDELEFQEGQDANVMFEAQANIENTEPIASFVQMQQIETPTLSMESVEQIDAGIANIDTSMPLLEDIKYETPSMDMPKETSPPMVQNDETKAMEADQLAQQALEIETAEMANALEQEMAQEETAQFLQIGIAERGFY